jgi:hypothetical protein
VRRCSGCRDQADVCPRVASGSHRQHALDLIRREVEAARQTGLSVRLLVPLTRSHGGAALQFEVELSSLDQVDQFLSARGQVRRRPTGCGPSARSSLHRLRSRSCASMTAKHPEGADQAPWRTRFQNPDRRGLLQASGHCAHCSPREGMAINGHERASTPWRYVSLAHWPADWQASCSLPMLVVVANEENHEPN